MVDEGISYFWAKICEVGYKWKLPNHGQEYRSKSLTGSDMAFVFAGKGVAELQEGGVLPTTIVSWAPRLPALGIYPTVESLLAQGVLAILLLAALVWTFLIEPRRTDRRRPRTALKNGLAEAPEPEPGSHR